MEDKYNKRNNIIIILGVLLLAAVGFICYDKLLIKKEPKKIESDCKACEKCNKEEQKIKTITCTLDMNGKTNIDVEQDCSSVIGYNSVVIKNIKVNEKLYEFKYRLDGLSNVINDDGSIDEYYYNYDNSVGTYYVNGKLIDAFSAKYSYVIMTVRIENGKIIVKNAFPSDIPPVEHPYDLSEFE